MFAFSAYYHNFWCESEKALLVLQKLDLIGTGLAIIGCTTPPLYYWLICDETKVVRFLFLFLIIFTCVIAMFYTTRAAEADSFAIKITFTIAAISWVPGYIYAVNGLDERLAHNPGTTTLIFCMAGALYAIGAVVKAFRVPESCNPGKFDYIG